MGQEESGPDGTAVRVAVRLVHREKIVRIQVPHFGVDRIVESQYDHLGNLKQFRGRFTPAEYAPHSITGPSAHSNFELVRVSKNH